MTAASIGTAAQREALGLMQAHDWRGALEVLGRAVMAEPRNPALRMHRARCLLALRCRREAIEEADAALRCAPADAHLLDAVGTLLSFAGDHRRALAAYDRAVSRAPREAKFLYNRASVRRFVGDLEGAEADYDQAIALQPQDYEAYHNRSLLRVQTPARNHVAELETVAARPFADWRGEVQVRYALAKEYEDLGDHAQSFAHLKRGADRRRAHMTYDVAVDVATVDWIIDAFPQGPAESPGSSESPGLAESPRPTASPAPAESPGPTASPAPAESPRLAESPIFIVGLPRSGTTLVERILGNHSLVTSAGELDCFALALTTHARQAAGRPLPRRELVAAAATLDFPALGREYLRLARAAFSGDGRFIDKMPLNYLYCGLIRRALPGAKIIHVTRHPMASGYAMYKTLFKDGYPFSYDLTDIGRYYAAYVRLMDHWNRTMPGVIHELRYERLIADQHGETRRLLSYCGLDWEDACADFHQNPAASTTASASQVRRPIYDSSVALWQQQAARLRPLREVLEAAGIAL